MSSAFRTSEANDKEITKETKEITKEITKENPKETKEIIKENPEELLDIVSSRSLTKIQANLLKNIIANPSVTFKVLSSELGLTIDQIRYQRKQLESKGIFLCHKGATKKGTWEIQLVDKL